MTKNKPDDYINNGLIEVARFGKNIIMRNIATPEQNKLFVNLQKAKYDSLEIDINNLISEIREKVVSCDPLKLLTFSADMRLITGLNLFSEFQSASEDICIARATEYIQSILVSSPSTFIDKVSKEDQSSFYSGILKEIEDLYTLINEFYICWRLKLNDIEPEYDDDLLNNMLEAQLLYLVRGNRYQVFEQPYYKSLLNQHNSIFVELFNITSNEILEGIKNIQYALSQGKVDEINKLKVLMEDLDNKNYDEEDFYSIHKNQFIDFQQKLLGFKLRDVIEITGWPEKFIKELSWCIDEENRFFNHSKFPGWPVIDLPIQKRPFIKIENNYYCFDYYSFIDNFYRVIQKTVTRLSPRYDWSNNQKIASETMVENLLKKMLPGCNTYTENYYPINNSKKNFRENDLILIYDNTLIVVEVKAGGFSYASPIADFESHIESYKKLIEEADDQCNGTINYLRTEDSPVLYNQKHEPKGTIDMTKINFIYMISVTIDNINSFAAKAEKLCFLNLKCNAISLSVDDLMVYQEYFNSPLIFLHFLKHRSLATLNKKISLNDELDHLGLYINHNYYTFQTNEFPKDATINFTGYREELDKYFTKLYFPQLKPKKPLCKIPDLFLNIINYLESNQIQNRSSISNYFLDFASDAKENLCKEIGYILIRQKQIKHMIPITASGIGDNLRYTCFVNQINVTAFTFTEKREYTLSSLLWNNDPDRYFIDLYFDQNNKFINIDFLKYTINDIKLDEVEKLKIVGKSIADFKMSEYKRKNKNKIGRNQLCPCGSGKKYKKCCGI